MIAFAIGFVTAIVCGDLAYLMTAHILGM